MRQAPAIGDGGEQSDGFAMTRAELRLTQWLAATAGVLLVAASLWVWIPAEGPTVVRSVERTVTTTSGQGDDGRRPSRTEVLRTTRTMSGDAERGLRRAAPARTSRRSEVLAGVLAAGGALLIFLGVTLPRLRGGTLPNDTGVHFDALRIVSTRARKLVAADTRLSERARVEAVDVVMDEYWRRQRRRRRWWRPQWTRRRESIAAERYELEEQIDRELAVRVEPPVATSAGERYQGDRIEALDPGDDGEIARVTYVYRQGEEHEHDVLHAGTELAGDTPGGQNRISRIILRHARGNRPVTEAAVERFADAYHDRMAKRLWTIRLDEVLGWIEQHLDESGEVRE